MLIGEESLFRKLPSALNKRQLRMFIGIRYSIEMYEVAFITLVENLKKIDGDGKVALDSYMYPSILSQAWSMVDASNRLRVLLSKMPGLSKRDPNFQVNFRKLETVVNLRNPIQHLDDEINDRANNPSVEPVWGSLSWGKLITTNPIRARVFLLLPGSLESQSGRPIVNVLGKIFNDTIGLIELTAYGTTLSLSEIYLAISKLTTLLESSMQKAFDDKKEFSDRLGADLLVTMEFSADDNAKINI